EPEDPISLKEEEITVVQDCQESVKNQEVGSTSASKSSLGTTSQKKQKGKLPEGVENEKKALSLKEKFLKNLKKCVPPVLEAFSRRNKKEEDLLAFQASVQHCNIERIAYYIDRLKISPNTQCTFKNPWAFSYNTHRDL